MIGAGVEALQVTEDDIKRDTVLIPLRLHLLYMLRNSTILNNKKGAK